MQIDRRRKKAPLFFVRSLFFSLYFILFYFPAHTFGGRASAGVAECVCIEITLFSSRAG